jgi:DNA-directed RNA polymerase specialized sigma24 family protein
MAAEINDMIEVALARLKIADRRIIEVFLENQSSKKTAEICNVTPRTVQRKIDGFRKIINAFEESD